MDESGALIWIETARSGLDGLFLHWSMINKILIENKLWTVRLKNRTMAGLLSMTKAVDFVKAIHLKRYLKLIKFAQV